MRIEQLKLLHSQNFYRRKSFGLPMTHVTGHGPASHRLRQLLWPALFATAEHCEASASLTFTGIPKEISFGSAICCVFVVHLLYCD